MKLGIGQPEVSYNGNILDINVPEQMESAIPTGTPQVDLLFAGDGIIAGTVTLITGAPGGGKTTFTLQMADGLTKMGHMAVVNTGEESLYQIRRTTKRLGLQHGFIPAYNRNAEDIIEHCEKLKSENPGKKLFLVIDSLQCLSVRDSGGRGRPKGDSAKQLEALQMLTEYAKNNWVCVFFIGHITKTGKFAGKQTIKHAIDCHLHLSYEPELEERVLEMQKNRFGVAGNYYEFELGESGLRFRG